jgi:hypothetical protein
MAAWWAAFGFALLFPANVSAIMYISTRAHLISTLFYLAAMIATLWFIRTQQFKTRAAVAVIAFTALSMFAKESGVTVIVAVAVVIFFERKTQDRKVMLPALIGLFTALIAVLVLYLGLRAHSRAVPINFSGGTAGIMGYALSMKVFWENLLMYACRTYGLLALLAVAITISLRLRGIRPRLTSLTKYDVLLSVSLFIAAIAPFILMPQRPGMYSYLPGISSALLLGAFTRSLYESASEPRNQLTPVTLAPILFVVALCVALTVVYSQKWVRLAETNTAVLSQITAQQPSIKPKTFVVLTYSEIDYANRFPEGFGDWCFPWALRVLYQDRTVDGKIIRRGESHSIGDKLWEIHFSYVGGDRLTVVKTRESVHRR